MARIPNTVHRLPILIQPYERAVRWDTRSAQGISAHSGPCGEGAPWTLPTYFPYLNLQSTLLLNIASFGTS